MRKKNANTKAMDGASEVEKCLLARYGAKRERAAIPMIHAAGDDWGRLSPEFAAAMHHLKPKQLRAIQGGARRRLKTVLAPMLVEQMRIALETGKADFFRDLADGIELYKQPIDPNRTRLLSMIAINTEIGGQPQTLALWKRRFEETWKTTIDKDQFRRLGKECGLPIAPDKIGAPKKSDYSRRLQS